jgi:hypothetical protein
MVINTNQLNLSGAADLVVKALEVLQVSSTTEQA